MITFQPPVYLSVRLSAEYLQKPMNGFRWQYRTDKPLAWDQLTVFSATPRVPEHQERPALCTLHLKSCIYLHFLFL